MSLARLNQLPTKANALVSGVYKNLAKPVVSMHIEDDDHHVHIGLPTKPQGFTNNGLNRSLLFRGNMKAQVSLSSGISVRSAHTDVKVPSFDEYRNSLTKNPKQKSREVADERQAYTYIATFGAAVITAYTAKGIVHDIVGNVAPSADVLALAKIEVKLSDIPEGKNVTVKWRNKPLFIKHRTAAEIENESKIDISTLRDPQLDSDRTQRPEWLVLLGVCTHLGCVPIPGAGDYKGYFCPCHGSHYDGSGRIRKGPAPLNLEIPPYQFVDDTLVVG